MNTYKIHIYSKDDPSNEFEMDFNAATDEDALIMGYGYCFDNSWCKDDVVIVLSKLDNEADMWLQVHHEEC